MSSLPKLRDIEILAQQRTEILEAEGQEDKTLQEIQTILYSTEVRSAEDINCLF